MIVDLMQSEPLVLLLIAGLSWFGLYLTRRRRG